MRILKDNKGSAVLEVTIIAPIILTIIVMVMFLYLDVMNSGYIQGNCYNKIYTYDSESNEKNLQELSGYVHTNSEDEDVFWGKKSQTGVWNNPLISREPWIYLYIDRVIDYCTEYDLCTDRLRRWQFYGDIVQ